MVGFASSKGSASGICLFPQRTDVLIIFCIELSLRECGLDSNPCAEGARGELVLLTASLLKFLEGFCSALLLEVFNSGFGEGADAVIDAAAGLAVGLLLIHEATSKSTELSKSDMSLVVVVETIDGEIVFRPAAGGTTKERIYQVSTLFQANQRK